MVMFVRFLRRVRFAGFVIAQATGGWVDDGGKGLLPKARNDFGMGLPIACFKHLTIVRRFDIVRAHVLTFNHGLVLLGERFLNDFVPTLLCGTDPIAKGLFAPPQHVLWQIVFEGVAYDFLRVRWSKCFYGLPFVRC